MIDLHHLPNDPLSRRIEHAVSAQHTLFWGQPDFFVPRFPTELTFESNPDSLSYYDTSPLRSCLEEFVDFDRINFKETRLSLGAVDVASGEMHYFDSLKDK